MKMNYSKRVFTAFICVCLMLTSVSVFAATIEKGSGDADYEFTSTADANILMLQAGSDLVQVTAYDSVDISEMQAQVANAYLNAKSAVRETVNDSVISEDEQGYVSYTFFGEDATYLYEESFDGLSKELKVFKGGLIKTSDLTDESSSDSAANSASLRAYEGPYGRVKFSGSGDYFTGYMELPKPNQIAGINNLTTGSNGYIYSGFSGSVETDMGLQMTNKESGGTTCDGWNPYLKVGGTLVSDFVTDYDQVNFKNFFLPSTATKTRQILFTVYPNFNNKGKVRIKLDGYAKYQSSLGALGGVAGEYRMISVQEYAQVVNNVGNYKVVTSIAVRPSGTIPAGAKMWAKFSSIKIETSAPSVYGAPSIVGNSTVTVNPSSGSVSTITMSVQE